MTFKPHHHIIWNLFMILICRQSIYAHFLSTGDHIPDYNAQLLTKVISFINTTENPCENFYGYACGNWVNNNGYATDLKIADVPSSLDNRYNHELLQMLEDGVKSNKPETKEIFNKLQDFYETCKNQKDKNVDHYLGIIKPTDEDDWPRDGESWNPKMEWSVWTTLAKLTRFGFNHLFFNFQFELSEDLTYYTAKWDSYQLDMAQVDFVKDQINATTDKKTTVILEQVIEFMNKVRGLYQETHVSPDSPHRTTIAHLKEFLKGMDVFLLGYIGADQYSAIKTADIKIATFLEKLIALVEATPRDVLIHTLKQSFRFYLTQQLPKSDIACVETLRELVPLAVDYMYGEEIYSHKNEQMEAAFEKVFLALKTKFSNIMQTEHGDIPADEISELSEKTFKMKLNFGNLPQGVDDRFYVNYFHSWEVVKADFYRNHLNALKRKSFDSRELLKLDEFAPLRKFSGLAETMPSYLLTSNVVVIPFSYIRYPMVHPEFDELFLYAEMGNTLARAMMHGFNLDGVEHDKDGNFFDRCTGPNLFQTCRTYRRNAKIVWGFKCLYETYGLEIPKVEERIADFSGFRLAYQTFVKTAEYSKLPVDTQLNKNKLFVIQFAQRFCINPNFDYDQTFGSPVTRITEIVENSSDFEEIFSCPQKTGKDAVQKCKVW